MNLTNENPIGCKEIAACGGLDTMSLLIASHFPMFSLPLPLVGDGFKLDHHDDKLLSDEELDFLVAILGLLVNLVEKDNHNRSVLLFDYISTLLDNYVSFSVALCELHVSYCCK